MMAPQSLVTKPLVTIAIPCFNAEAFIERAIKSAQSQDWPNTEILIVDDASKDGSVAIIEALAKKDKRIRLICHEANRGTAVARNTLLENARGEFIAFFDADDVSYPERVRLQYQRLTNYEQEKGADLILCYAGVKIIPVKRRSFEKKGIGYRSPEPVGENYVRHYIPVKSNMKKCVWGYCGSGALFMRRAVFNHVGPFDPALPRAEDSDYAMRAGLKGAHFISVDQTLLDWYINKADYKSSKKILFHHLLMLKKYRYLFSNMLTYFLSVRFAKASVCFYIARTRRGYLAIIWYFGQVCLWYFLMSPRAFLNRGWAKLEDIVRNKDADRAEMVNQKAGK